VRGSSLLVELLEFMVACSKDTRSVRDDTTFNKRSSSA